MSINLKGKTELEQGNGRVQTNAKRNGDGILVKENDSRINRSEEDVKDRSEDAVQVHQQQQSPQWSVVHWERFLHIKSIKVLLVENDDSTRHVVTALLRNLKYEVIVAANGLQAWKILEDLTNHIDIVLTEVVMPCLSGIGLLCKIMSHKTRKNIPVIMMSSHDAMGLVFKCLSKGAVDFLVKPVRKNELKNLWQHVWRRCHSSSGSGSESGTRTQKSIRSKSRHKSDNCSSSSSSDDEDDNESTDLKIGAESDDDSSSQNSWAKEVDSSQAMSSWDQTAKFSDSTCAKLRSNVKIFNGKLVPVTAPKEFQERDEQNGNIWKGKSSVIGKRKGFELQLESPNEDHEKKLEIKNKVIDDSIKEPDIDLSLKRRRVFKDTRKAAQVDHSVLRRSDLSAFSRYNKTSDAFKPPNGANRNNSLIVCLQIMKNKSVCDTKSCPSGALLYLRSDGVKVDKGSITDELSINPSVVLKDKLEATPAINDLNLSVFSPMKVDLNCPSQKVILVETDDLASTPVLAPLMGSAQEHPVQHIHHHHHVHHFHNIDGLRPLSNHDDLSLSIFTGAVEDNTANHSLTKSGSDSKNGSNGQIGSSTFVHAGCTNVENDVQGGAESGNGNASGSGGGNKIDRNKSAFREAALTRFRQKKKEQRLKEQRLGGVQVRYDDRKRLAEQRLRARGRFARQMGGDGSNTAADS